jgi:hypothetical protein
MRRLAEVFRTDDLALTLAGQLNYNGGMKDCSAKLQSFMAFS